jgi:hypothetical protein
MLTAPDSALPDCARTHENVSGPSPSDPLPVQVPVRFSGVVAGEFEGAAACVGPPAQPGSSEPPASAATTATPQRAAHCVTAHDTANRVKRLSPDAHHTVEIGVLISAFCLLSGRIVSAAVNFPVVLNGSPGACRAAGEIGGRNGGDD